MKAKLLTVSRFVHQLLALAALSAIPVFVYWRTDLVDARIGREFGLPGKGLQVSKVTRNTWPHWKTRSKTKVAGR
jgi:hypothetical protein